MLLAASTIPSGTGTPDVRGAQAQALAAAQAQAPAFAFQLKCADGVTRQTTAHVPAMAQVPQTRGRSPGRRGLERTVPAWVPRAMTGTHPPGDLR